MPSASRFSPLRFHLTIALVLAIGGALSLWWLVGARNTWSHWLLAWLAAINVVAFGYFGFDKMRSQQQGRRVPELVLHALSAAGGSFGAYAAMELFRHKTVKGRFRILFWCTATVQTLLLVWAAKLAWW